MRANRLSFNFLCPSNSHNKYTYKEIESKQNTKKYLLRSANIIDFIDKIEKILLAHAAHVPVSRNSPIFCYILVPGNTIFSTKEQF